MLKKPSYLVILFTIIFGLILSSCRVLISQNPRDSFADKKLPLQLEIMANQKQELTAAIKERIVERVKRDKNNPNIFEVAVIDSGLDLWHPDYVDQLSFRLEGGEIKGVGTDLMAQDDFPSYVMIDPTLFAFGAEAVRDGLIVKPLSSPLPFMKKINDRFTQILLEEIANNPELKKSFFARLESGAMSVFGMETALKDWTKGDAVDSYKKRKASYPDQIVTAETKYVGDGQTVTDSYLDEAQKGWLLDVSTGAPFAMRAAAYISGFDQFYDAVKTALEKVHKETDFNRHAKQLKDFLSAHTKNTDGTTDNETVERTYEQITREAGNYILIGYKAQDPLIKLRNTVAKLTRDPTITTKKALDELPKITDDAFAKLNKLDFNNEEREQLKLKRLAFNAYLEAVKQMSILTEDSSEGDKARSNFRRFALRNYHPFISGETIGNLHSTHVASTVARQNPNIRIYPIKVVVQTITAPVEQKRLSLEVLTNLKAWLDSPIVKKLIVEIEGEYGVKDLSPEKLITQIEKFLKRNSLDVIFINQVFEAIKTVGQKKIKIANFSLGTTYKKKHEKAEVYASIAEDIFSEFARYKIGETIAKYAPKTLFFVATGNDQSWVDGVSRTAFPVGITSHRFRLISEKEKLPHTPNNQVHNVVAVGSVNPNRGTLTPFTNLLIDPNIPQIFSTGEEIMGSIPSSASAQYQKLAQESLGLANKTLSGFDDSLKKFRGKNKDNDFIDLKEKILSLNHVVTNVDLLYPSFLQTQIAITRDELSGTSMATPTAAGKTADEENKLQMKLGLRPENIYDHPEFTPEKILERVMARAEKSPMSQAFIIRTLTKQIETWPESEGIAKLKAATERVKLKAEVLKKPEPKPKKRLL